MTETNIIFTGPSEVDATKAMGMMSEMPLHESPTVDTTCGALQIDDDLVLRFYGTPEQPNRKHLAQDALGFLIFVDNASPTPLADLTVYLNRFQPYIDASAAVIVVTHAGVSAPPDVTAYHRFLSERDECYPVVATDVSQLQDVLEIVDMLLISVSERAPDACGVLAS